MVHEGQGHQRRGDNWTPFATLLMGMLGVKWWITYKIPVLFHTLKEVFLAPPNSGSINKMENTIIKQLSFSISQIERGLFRMKYSPLLFCKFVTYHDLYSLLYHWCFYYIVKLQLELYKDVFITVGYTSLSLRLRFDILLDHTMMLPGAIKPWRPYKITWFTWWNMLECSCQLDQQIVGATGLPVSMPLKWIGCNKKDQDGLLHGLIR